MRSPGYRYDQIAMDTSVAIDLLKGKAAAHAAYGLGQRLLLPTPVIAELVFGDLKGEGGQLTPELEGLLANALVIEITSQIARRQAELRLQLTRRGNTIPTNDLWIAACCLVTDVPLVNDDEHFDRVDGLRVIRP